MTLKKLTNRSQSMVFAMRVQKLNWVVIGWINYFAICSMKTAMNDIDAHLSTRLRVIIWKQWKVPKKRQWGLQKLGIGRDLARQTSYMGDRYQWIVTKTCVVRAISKEKTVTSRTGQLLRLLHGTSCFEVMLNRCMPNGTYWWCERGIKFPLLDLRKIETYNMGKITAR